MGWELGGCMLIETNPGPEISMGREPCAGQDISATVRHIPDSNQPRQGHTGKGKEQAACQQTAELIRICARQLSSSFGRQSFAAITGWCLGHRDRIGPGIDPLVGSFVAYVFIIYFVF